MKRLLNWIGKLRIKRKLLVIYALTGILPVVCLGAFLIGNTQNLILRQRQAQAEEENKRVKIVVFDVTYLAANISQIIYSDDALEVLVSRQYEDASGVYEAYRGYTLFDTYMSNYTEISGITVYVNNSTMLPYKHFQIVTDEVKKTDWYQRAASSKGEILWTVDPAENQDGHLFLVRKIPAGRSGGFAILRIGVSNNFLKLMIRDSKLHSVIALAGGSVFFSEYDAEVGSPLPVDADWGNPQVTHTGWEQYRGVTALVSGSALTPINSADAALILTTDEDAIRDMNSVALSISLIVAVSLLVPFVIILLFTGSFSRRILTLRHEMHKVAAGDLDIAGSFSGQDELGDVYADMKTMIGCIQNLYLEIYNEKLTKEKLAIRQQRIEFEMLASQINPHFLFNTLETIRMKALVNNDDEVAHITKLLGKSIRHVLEVGSDPVPMAQELKYVKIYVDIQIFRYREKIGYTLGVAGDVCAEAYRILPLLLQPVVENSIVHGLENKKGGGWVSVEIRHRDRFLAITVSDNGVGMSRERRKAVEDSLQGADASQPKGSIGLANVCQRIKLYYGQEYGMEIESALNKGTVVTLLLPPYEGRREKDAGTDR
jgi:two-component system sensor histidine kinase YesM